LFDELALPAPGKTAKTKSYSTAADVLEALAPVYPIAQKVLDYRQVTKLKSTYVDALPALAYDHADIVRYAHERLRSKILYTNTVHTLIPPHFTLTQLQQAYEAIIGRALDKRNFRKKFLSLGLAEATDEYTAEGAHRPARLYRFTRDELQVLSRSFD